MQDLPGVGENLLDHPVVNTRFRVKTGESLNWLARPHTVADVLRTVKALLQYRMYGTGPLTCNVRSPFVRLIGSSSNRMLTPYLGR